MTDVYTLSELAEKCGAQLQGDANKPVSGLNTLQDAKGHELSFLANPAYAKYLETTQAGAVILSPDSVSGFTGNALILDNPYLGYARLSSLFDPDRGGKGGYPSQCGC